MQFHVLIMTVDSVSEPLLVQKTFTFDLSQEFIMKYVNPWDVQALWLKSMSSESFRDFGTKWGCKMKAGTWTQGLS